MDKMTAETFCPIVGGQCFQAIICFGMEDGEWDKNCKSANEALDRNDYMHGGGKPK